MGVASDWSEVKRRWESGEPIEKIAVACRRKQIDIEDTAKRERWKNDKRPKANKPRARAKLTTPSTPVAAHVVASTAEVRVDVLDPSDYLEQHRDDWQGLRLTAIKMLAAFDHLDPNAQAKQLSAIATALKLVQDGQRKHFGVDKTTVSDGADEHADLTMMQHRQAERVSAD